MKIASHSRQTFGRTSLLSTLFILASLLVGALSAATPGSTSAADIKRATPLDYDPNVLSYGIYWFGLDNARQKFVPGETNSYFDPARPTLIFVHGWQPGISATYPPNFTYQYLDGLFSKSVNTANAWLGAGWNVGIFFWNQFSDELDNVQYAEAKIWTPTGPQRMRWRKGDGTYAEAPAGTPSAAELFYEAYAAAMTEQTYTGGNIRLAGHSLGNQMAVRLAKLVDDGISAGTLPAHLRPTRVALLDPYWSPGAKDYLNGDTTGARIRDYVAELVPAGTLFEWYRSSVLTVEPQGDSNAGLEPMMMYADMDPAFESYDMSHMREHCAAYQLYFWSYAFDGPPACSGASCLGMNKLLSKMSDAQLAAISRSDYRWEQIEGASTATPADDTYQSSLAALAPYTVTLVQASPPAQAVGGIISLTATVRDKEDNLAGDGVLITWGTDLGAISARSVTSGGVALAFITSGVTGTAHISITTLGAGGPAQGSAAVVFGDVLPCTPLANVAISDPVSKTGTLYIDTLYTFDAILTPTDATPPITYTWSPTPANGQNHASATYQWTMPGLYTITLAAENCGGIVKAVPAVVTVIRPHQHAIYLPLVLHNHGE